MANTQAQNIVVTINGKSFSQNFISLEIGYESYQQGTGLVTKKGTLTIANIYEDPNTLDPTATEDFNVGNEVLISWNGSPHPVGYKTLILTPPEVSTIVSSLPMLEGNLMLKIPIGCWLAFSLTDQPDSDKSGVTFGHPLGISQVVTNLLEASKIPTGSLSVSSITNIKVGFPFPKNGGSFTTQAGQLAYASRVNKPSFLYCDTNNIVKDLGIATPPDNFTVEIILGTHDKLYQRQIDKGFLPGIINISGTKRKVSDSNSIYPFTTEENTYKSNLLVAKTTKTYYKVEKDDVTLPPNIQIANALTTDKHFGYSQTSGLLPGIYYIYLNPDLASIYWLAVEGLPRVEYINGVTVLPEFLSYWIYPGYTATYEKSSSYQYNSAGVSTQVSKSENYIFYDRNNRQILDFSRTDLQRNTFYKNGSTELLPASIQLVYYEYNSKGIITTKYSYDIVHYTKLTPTLLFTVLGIPYWVAIQKYTKESWIEKGTEVLYQVEEYVPKIINNPSISLSGLTYQNFSLPGGPLTLEKAITINNPNAQRPGTNYFSGRFTVQDNPVTEEITFGSGTNTRSLKLQIPLLFNLESNEPIDTTPQLANFGIIEGRLHAGRQFQYLIECEPSILEGVDSPLYPIAVREPEGKRYFLADALTWHHTRNSTSVAFAGILVGSSSLLSSVPTTIPSALQGVEQLVSLENSAGYLLGDNTTGTIEF